jgi:hypothetical protein
VCQNKKNLQDLSLFLTLFSAVAMTVLCTISITGVWYEPNFNVQAQTIEDDIPKTLSSGVSATIGTMPTIKITSHINGQQVKTGPLTISGTSSDTPATNCQVYADWNDNVPFGKAIAAGPGGPNDYSKWTFTYGNDYHPINNGTNNLTSKISCDDGSTPLTKWSSINLVGVNSSDPGSVISQAITSGNPSPSPTSPSLPMGLPLPAPNQPIATSSPLDPIVGEEDEDEESNENDENDDSDSTDNNSDDDNDNVDNEDDGGSNGSGESLEDSQDEDNGDSGNNDDDGDNDEDGDDDDGPVNFGPNGPVD